MRGEPNRKDGVAWAQKTEDCQPAERRLRMVALRMATISSHSATRCAMTYGSNHCFNRCSYRPRFSAAEPRAIAKSAHNPSDCRGRISPQYWTRSNRHWPSVGRPAECIRGCEQAGSNLRPPDQIARKPSDKARIGAVCHRWPWILSLIPIFPHSLSHSLARNARVTPSSL